MEYMRVQTRLRFILSFERVKGNGVRTHVNSKGTPPLPPPPPIPPVPEGSEDAASSRIETPTHYQLSYSGPSVSVILSLLFFDKRPKATQASCRSACTAIQLKPVLSIFSFYGNLLGHVAYDDDEEEGHVYQLTFS